MIASRSSSGNFGEWSAVWPTMMPNSSSPTAWAERVFQTADLGDARRNRRLVRIAGRVAAGPAGRVTAVFRNAAERQAAYDFLEHDQVPTAAVGDAVFTATAQVGRKHERVFVVLDGTSLQLVDESGSKGFGHIGSFAKGAHGLKLINALALTTDGTPLGVADQVWWSRHERAKHEEYRSADHRESVHWRAAATRILQRYAEHAPATKLHFLADREADATYLIELLVGSGHEFTIRSNATRRVAVGSKRIDLRRRLAALDPVAQMEVELPATATRRARVASLDVRAARLPIVWRDHHVGHRRVVPITVVWARERRRGQRVEWFLFTNTAVTTAAAACAVVRGYTLRWRIEDFHKTWKSGVCRVEDTQLRSVNAVIKWATILAAVAARAEHLRHRCRAEPNAPASEELTSDEIEALVLIRQDDNPGAPFATAEHLTIQQATRWIADAGGYVGGRGSGLPGATTIARGLQRISAAAAVIASLRAAGRLR